MPVDANIALQASVTKTASFSGSALILPSGTPRRGLKARIVYSAASAASGTDTVTFSVDVCYDGVPTTWNVTSSSTPITLVTSGTASGEIYLPFDISPTSVVNGTQIRITATFSSSAHTDTITYFADLALTRP
jgi:hypothetical protein